MQSYNADRISETEFNLPVSNDRDDLSLSPSIPDEANISVDSTVIMDGSGFNTASDLYACKFNFCFSIISVSVILTV